MYKHMLLSCKYDERGLRHMRTSLCYMGNATRTTTKFIPDISQYINVKTGI